LLSALLLSAVHHASADALPEEIIIPARAAG
jgi:hypothetical protein